MLQRFGITYFIVATTGVIFMESFEPKLAESSKWNAIKDCLSLWQRWIVAALVTILHCLLTFALPVPGCPTGIQSLIKTKANFFQVRFFYELISFTEQLLSIQEDECKKQIITQNIWLSNR